MRLGFSIGRFIVLLLLGFLILVIVVVALLELRILPAPCPGGYVGLPTVKVLGEKESLLDEADSLLDSVFSWYLNKFCSVETNGSF